MVGELNYVFIRMLSLPEFPLRVGLMVATAMIIGAIIDGDWRVYWKWGLLAVIYTAYQYWVSYYVIPRVYSSNIEFRADIFISIFLTLLFSLGAFLGSYIVEKAKAPYRARRRALEARLDILMKRIEESRKEITRPRKEVIEERRRSVVDRRQFPDRRKSDEALDK